MHLFDIIWSIYWKLEPFSVNFSIVTTVSFYLKTSKKALTKIILSQHMTHQVINNVTNGLRIWNMHKYPTPSFPKNTPVTFFGLFP